VTPVKERSSFSIPRRNDYLKISVSKIPEGGRELQLEKDGSWFKSFLPEMELSGFVLDRIDVACTIRRMKETVFIDGTVAANLETSCCRCLETTHLPVSSSFKYTFSPPPDQPREEWELSAEDLDFAYYEEDIIDMDTLIFEQIALQIPVKPLCMEGCKGLCPHCGINLNVTSCQCGTENFDERLAVLKQFKTQPEKPFKIE
jgi:uncharacterized protein